MTEEAPELRALVPPLRFWPSTARNPARRSRSCSAREPRKISSNQQLSHLSMMRVLHRNFSSFKAVLLHEGMSSMIVIVGHQEISSESACNLKEPIVIHLPFVVKSLGCHRVGRVYEV